MHKNGECSAVHHLCSRFVLPSYDSRGFQWRVFSAAVTLEADATPVFFFNVDFDMSEVSFWVPTAPNLKSIALEKRRPESGAAGRGVGPFCTQVGSATPSFPHVSDLIFF